MDEPPDTYTVGGVGRICDQADGPKLRRNEKMITTLFDRSIRAPSRGGQQIKSLWAWNQPGIWPCHRAVTSNSTSQRRLLAPSRQVNGIRRRYLYYGSLVRPRTRRKGLGTRCERSSQESWQTVVAAVRGACVPGRRDKTDCTY